MEAYASQDEDSFVGDLESVLFQGVRILKKLVDVIKKNGKYDSPQGDDLMENRINDAIFQLNIEIDQVREMIPVTKINNCVSNLHELDMRITNDINHMKNAIDKSASFAVVERDIQDIEREFNSKINKIHERVARNEKNNRLQIEKFYFDLFQMQGNILKKLATNDSVIAGIGKKLDSKSAVAVTHHDPVSDDSLKEDTKNKKY